MGFIAVVQRPISCLHNVIFPALFMVLCNFQLCVPTISLHHSPTAPRVVPGDGSLDHIAIIGSKKQHGNDERTTPPMLSIGVGLPLVPRKLVNQIQSGEFVDMVELLPDRLGVSANP